MSNELTADERRRYAKAVRDILGVRDEYPVSLPLIYQAEEGLSRSQCARYHHWLSTTPRDFTQPPAGGHIWHSSAIERARALIYAMQVQS